MARRPRRNAPPPKPKLNPRTARNIIDNLNEDDLLYRTIWYEASGEGQLGMALVANAIFNRKDMIDQGVRIGLFQANDKTFKGILTGKNQFEPVTGNRRVVNGLNPREQQQVTEAIKLAADKVALANEIKKEVKDISNDDILSLLNATGFRGLNAKPDKSQDVNVVTFKGHKFNTAGNKDRTLVKLPENLTQPDEQPPIPRERPDKSKETKGLEVKDAPEGSQGGSIMEFLKKGFGRLLEETVLPKKSGASTLEEQTDKMLGLSKEEKRKAAETSDDPLSDAMGPRLITQQKSSPVDPAALRKELQFFNRDREDKEPMGPGDEEADAQMSFPDIPVDRSVEELAEFPERDDTKSLNYPTPTDAELDQKDMDFVGRPPRYFITKEGSFNQGDPFDEDDNLVRARFEREEMGDFDDPTPMGEADPRDEDDDVIGDFTFIKDLFRGGFDIDDDTDDDTDFFADEPMPMGGEADPKEDVANFEKGGEVKADFDGKKDEDEDEGDPPPLAKPEEVADDIPALLSEGEYVLPANVVRYIGLERIMDMHRQVLAEIQQMEDLGMIQNVDKNGEPEDDDDEMKFAEGEEGVTKGTIIIASAKPKGMMCPEPLMMNGGGSAGGDDSAAGDEASGAADADAAAADAAAAAADAAGIGADTAEQSGRNAPAGPGELGFEGREKAGGLTETEKAGMPDTERAALGLDETATELDVAFAKSKKGLVERGLYGLGKLGERMGIDVTEKAAAGREAAEAEASQPGDMDFEISEENIKQDKVDDVISDLITKNVYIEGVGYVPLASLMSPRNDVTV